MCDVILLEENCGGRALNEICSPIVDVPTACRQSGLVSRAARAKSRRAISLLEVVLAIAILGMSMVAITSLLAIGYRAAASSRLRTDAALHCDTKMAELAAGVLDLSSTSNTPVEGTPDWVYSVDVQPASQVGLLAVTVTVEQVTTSAAPISMSVVRFMPDPDYDPTEAEE